MAVITNVINSKLKLSLEKGMDEQGEPVLKSKTFSNVSASATDEDVYGVGETLASLQDLPLEEITRLDEIKLIKQG